MEFSKHHCANVWKAPPKYLPPPPFIYFPALIVFRRFTSDENRSNRKLTKALKKGMKTRNKMKGRTHVHEDKWTSQVQEAASSHLYCHLSIYGETRWTLLNTASKRALFSAHAIASFPQIRKLWLNNVCQVWTPIGGIQ